MNFVKNNTLKMWILSKIIFLKCEFCEKWCCFENVNFVKNEIFKMWSLWNYYVQIWIFGKIRIFAPVCFRRKNNWEFFARALRSIYYIVSVDNFAPCQSKMWRRLLWYATLLTTLFREIEQLGLYQPFPFKRLTSSKLNALGTHPPIRNIF